MSTPAENIAEAQRILDVLAQPGVGPNTQMYQNLAQRAIGHGLLAAADVLAAILAQLEAKQAPVIPGMPQGYDIATEQTGNGYRHWRYVVTGPSFSYASRYRYGTSEGALTAGIQHCQEQEKQRKEAAWMPLLDAAREAQALNEPVDVTINGNSGTKPIDVTIYGNGA